MGKTSNIQKVECLKEWKKMMDSNSKKKKNKKPKQR
jgi:hypothetical protein